MGLFSSINIAATGLTAQRTRLDVIANNIANAETTRTPEGGVFLRSRTVFEPIVQNRFWKTPFLPDRLDQGPGKGVRITSIEKDTDADVRLVWDPSHPDALKTGPKAGYVEYPNVNVVTEMVDMIAASRSYEANSSMINGSKSMFLKALEIGR